MRILAGIVESIHEARAGRDIPPPARGAIIGGIPMVMPGALVQPSILVQAKPTANERPAAPEGPRPVRADVPAGECQG